MSQVVVGTLVLVDPGILAVGVGAGVARFVPQRQKVNVLAGLGQDLRPLDGC